MKFSELTEKYKYSIKYKYLEEGKSTYVIAKELGTNAKMIQRALAHLEIPRRSYSEAQKKALESGAAKHPTKGKRVSESTKTKLSRAITKYWGEMSEEERIRRSEISKEQWDAMTEEERKTLFAKAAEGCRKAAKDGSKLEKFVVESLSKDYKVKHHDKKLVKNEKLELDIYLPDLNTVIEIDGISHFEPIWGEEHFLKQQRADAVKSGLVLSLGFVMIRVKQTCRHITKAKMVDTLMAINIELDKIKEKFPEEKDRYIELEID